MGVRRYGKNGRVGPAKRFTWAEYACHDGTSVPAGLRGGAARNARGLNMLRAAVAGRYKVEKRDVSIHVDSGYRTASYNAKIGGASHSQHIIARAADVKVFVRGKQIDPETIARIAESVPRFRSGGIGWYDSKHGYFTHLDVRGTYGDSAARWVNG